MADDANPAEPNVKALIERVRRQHWHKSHWRNDQCTEMCGCGGPWPCDVLDLLSLLERAQADTARLDWLAANPSASVWHVVEGDPYTDLRAAIDAVREAAGI